MHVYVLGDVKSSLAYLASSSCATQVLTSFFRTSFNSYVLVSLGDAPMYLQVESQDQYTLHAPSG